jgi:hypothetical protein
MSDNNYRKFWEHHRACVYSGNEYDKPIEYHLASGTKWLILKYKGFQKRVDIDPKLMIDNPDGKTINCRCDWENYYKPLIQTIKDFVKGIDNV